MKAFGLTAVLMMALLVTTACANHPCTHIRNPELAAQAGGTAPAPASAPPIPTAAGAVKKEGNSAVSSSTNTANNTVLVYKADGSLQCGAGKGLALDDMEKELKGIRVLSRDKRADGKMHIQLCGSPTGMINVYEIPESSLKTAEGRGFKKL